MPYIELHRHSDFSTLDGCSTNTQFAERAVELDMWALGLSDHANINGALDHMKACELVGIQPIVGMEAYYRPTVIREKEWQHRRWHLLLIAKDLTGWHNLLRISSAAYWPENFYQYPTVTDELLRRYNEGLHCTTACVLGPLCYLIENATDAQRTGWIRMMKDIFGERLSIEIQPHGFARQVALNKELVSDAQREGIMLSVGGDAHYVLDGWVDTQKISILIGLNKTVADADEAARKRAAEGLDPYDLWHDGMHLMSTSEVLQKFAENHPELPNNAIVEAMVNNESIAQSCVPFVIDRSLKMPRGDKTMDEAERIVREWCREGMDKFGLTGIQEYEDQLTYEFSIIDVKKHWLYLYITGDIVRWARSTDPFPPTDFDPDPQPKHPMRVGSSRGSAGASLACYTARITSVNPIRHKLKFERFLNLGRKGIPDIDIDFPDDRRWEVKEYAARKFGREHIADIIAMARFTPRAAVKDVARIMGIDYRETESVTDQMDPVHDVDLESMRERMPVLERWARRHPEAWVHAVRLENAGNPFCSRVSKHAAGVVITPGPINDYMATIRSDEDDLMPRTAWSETPRLSIVDDFGFCKWDFLSARGLSQQDRIVALIAERTGKYIDLDELPCCFDPYDVEDEVMEIFRRGLTLGIWQFESTGITAFLKQAQPQNVVDLAAINALYRPGPMGGGGHNRYAKRARGADDYEVPEPLIPVVGDTYGVHCFQEQIMEIFQVLCGYSAAQADEIRKEIDKLNRGKSGEGKKRLSARADEFVTKASAIIGSDKAQELWAEILPYTGYSFNRPHSTGYSAQAYQDAWLKKHYPFEFYAVLLSLEDEKTLPAMRESRYFGVSIGKPDVNISKMDYTVDFESKEIRFGLIGIDGIGEVAAKQVMEKAPYESMDHFRLSHSFKYSKVNAGSLQALIESGALDAFGVRDDWTESQRATTETRRLGFSLRAGGTFGDDEEFILGNTYTQDEVAEMDSDMSGISVAGRITDIRKTVTKRGKNPGQSMAMVKIKFGMDAFELTFFPKQFLMYEDLISKGEGIIVDGRKDSGGSIIVSACMSVGAYVRERKRVAA